MSNFDLTENSETLEPTGWEPEVIVADVVPEHAPQTYPAARVVRRRVFLPLGLFVATCLSTLFAGIMFFGLSGGCLFSVAVMTVLMCHEAGHFFQARRYGVYASFPYFLPMPLAPWGTLGAVIVMGSGMRDRRALFDIGITGPLAGLVPSLAFCVIGLQLAPEPAEAGAGAQRFGDPLLLQMLARLQFGPIEAGYDILLNPMLFAGWVGLLVTALNLLPIGQLDGGHVLYALLLKKARYVASIVLLAAVMAVIWRWDLLFGWTLLLFLLFLMGPVHPPTANDDMPLGIGRTILGWLTLAFIPIGFTPTPLILH